MSQQFTDLEIERGIKIGGTEYDRRRALTDDEQDYAVYLYNIKGYTLSRIAQIMHMSPPGILYIVDPEYRERKRQYSKTRQTTYQDVDDVVKCRKERIKYKRDLLEAGLVKMEER